MIVSLSPSLIKKYEDKAKEKVPENEKDIVIFCMPYLGHYSLQVKDKLDKLIQRCYPNIDFKVIFRCPRRIMSYFSFKDRLSILLCSGVCLNLSALIVMSRTTGKLLIIWSHAAESI